MGYEDLLRVGVPFLLGLVIGGYLRGPLQALLTVGALVLAGYGWLYPEKVEVWGQGVVRVLEAWVRWGTERAIEVFVLAVNRPHDFIAWAESLVRSVPPMWAFLAGVLGGVRG